MSKQNETNDFWEWAEEHKEELPTEVYLQLANLALQRFRKCINSRKCNASRNITFPRNTRIISNEIRTLGNVPFVRGHTGSVNSVVINNNKIISGSHDRTIKIWDLNTDN